MISWASARKHSVIDENAIAAAGFPLVAEPLDDENLQRQSRIEFDTEARLLVSYRTGCGVLREGLDPTRHQPIRSDQSYRESGHTFASRSLLG